MKRIKIMLILMLPLFLTGCAETLKCEIETNNYNSTIKIKFDNNKPTTYKYKDFMKFTPNSADAEIYYHSKYEQYSFLILEKYAHIRNKSDGVHLKINYDFSKNNSDGESSLLINKNDTIKTATEKIKSSGYKCK